MYIDPSKMKGELVIEDYVIDKFWMYFAMLSVGKIGNILVPIGMVRVRTGPCARDKVCF